MVLALCSVGVLTAAHILHRRYQRVPVPALRFWSAALKRHRQDTLGGRFRHPLTWLLLAAVAGLLILGMLEPAPSGDRGPRPWVVIVDTRATMALPCATASTRLARAQEVAGAFLDRTAGPAGVTLIAVGPSAAILARHGDPKTEALYHLDRLTCTGATDGLGMDQALTLADTLVRCKPRTEVLVLTDHALTGLDLPETLRPRLTVRNVAESTDNLAVLSPEVTPSSDGTVRLQVWVAHWGDAACRAAVTLLKDGQTREERTVSMGADEVQTCGFQVDPDEIPALSVRVARERGGRTGEAYTLDDQTGPLAWRRGRVFLAQDAPAPLKAAVAANPAYQRVASASGADVCVTLASGTQASADTYSAVQVTQALCPDEGLRQAWMTDLFVGPNPSTVPFEGPGILLLTTAQGQPLAVRLDTVPPQVTLSASLFDDRTTFWKQPQVLAILDAALWPAERPDTEGRSPARPQAWYSDLTLSSQDLLAAQALPAVRPPVQLARVILWAALMVAVFELVCFYSGRIV